MGVACDLKSDCGRWTPLSSVELVEKYGGRVPRYTSYPTAPHFHAGIGSADYRAWLQAIPAEEPVSLYLHVPFCQDLCWYCGCHTSVARQRAPIADYVDTLIEEIALLGAAIGRRLHVCAIHFGGGTPNSLEPEDLDRIFERLRRSFSIADDAEIAAEIDPRVLTRAFVAAAARNGMTRASIGVQDIDPTVQAAINRRQPWATTVSAVEALREAGVGSINFDLLYGLPYQTRETLVQTAAQVIELQPDRIALFGYAHVPWMKPSQRLLPEQALPGSAERFDQQAAAAAVFTKGGYVSVGLDHFARVEDPLAQALAGGSMHRNFQGYTTDDAPTLLGLGASSIGRLREGYVQNQVRVPQWREAIAAGELPIARGIALDADDRLRGWAIERLMCDFSLDLAALEQTGGLEQLELDGVLRALEPLCSDGLVTLHQKRIVLTERGRPFVRSICAVFDRYLDGGGQRHSAGV